MSSGATRARMVARSLLPQRAVPILVHAYTENFQRTGKQCQFGARCRDPLPPMRLWVSRARLGVCRKLGLRSARAESG
eukprot:CAMPEP_0179214890 /NCGR_PEP_ID=MMETSP0797-20121207/2566_1 /TAXON_ID=47934 /ORGANISM="Dinophysis acuminata, Strain DAEP01" /LENGTH=77 /DNA_ID=CAMNT_0020920971 /DNA_START=59 /DNA_END=289 /DNA_ORIENTATION=-